MPNNPKSVRGQRLITAFCLEAIQLTIHPSKLISICVMTGQSLRPVKWAYASVSPQRQASAVLLNLSGTAQKIHSSPGTTSLPGAATTPSAHHICNRYAPSSIYIINSSTSGRTSWAPSSPLLARYTCTSSLPTLRICHAIRPVCLRILFWRRSAVPWHERDVPYCAGSQPRSGAVGE